ncbi:hypothetical protein [Azospirillum rugosum]|uniref:Uncharacterized protein n=1 Tax=Azospirillum rugosum TaxID=416170 RepID=A0ABS4SI09_9PROT|nr:hypothetical protein [Azospirillum rugosum]MBP2291055.1 hypothetical protein [Azospirillum rugosum]MDQ0524881.1 hypothetical protein [Azospirillum rugosum]
MSAGQPPPDRPDAQQIADKALADSGGDEAAARLLLAHQLAEAARAMSSGFSRLGQPERRG